MSTGGLDPTGRPIDPAEHAEGTPYRDRSSPSCSEDEFSGKVVRPEKGAQSGSALDDIDFADAVTDDGADVRAVVRDSRVYEVLAELDEGLVAMKPVKQRIREIAALLVI